MSGPASIFSPASDAARVIATLGWWVTILFVLVGIATMALIVIAALRTRGTLAEHASPELETGKSWIVIGGVLIPVVILSTVFIAGLAVMGAFPLHGPHPGEMIRVTGRQWWWDIEYRYGGASQYFRTANELHVPVGRTVDIELASSDVIHSFWVPQLHGKLDLIPGTVNVLRFRADKAGVYAGTCAEYCGKQHAHMRLLVIAESPERFAQWLRTQRMPAPSPSDTLMQRGHDLFMTRACATCHTIRGTPAQAIDAPDLTHIASRLTLAAGTLPNTRGNLQGWVTSAQALKPGSLMPNLPEFTGQELNALVSYLENLK